MSNDFQALPPIPPPPAATPASDHFVQMDFRKPEKQQSVWRLVAVAVAAGLVAVLALGLVWHRAAPPPGAPVAPLVVIGPSNSIEGTWVATAVTIDGEKAADAGVTLMLGDAERFQLDLLDRTYSGQYLARSGSINLIEDTEIFAVRGIYEQDGDRLTICFAKAERPSDFTAEKGSGRTLLVMKRQSSLREER